MTIASSTTKPGRDRERHERQVVEAVAEQVHHAERARRARAARRRSGSTVAATLRRKTKITPTTSATVSRSSNWTSLTDARIVIVRSVSDRDLDRLRAAALLSWGRSSSTRSTTSMMLAPGLALDVEDHGGRRVPSRRPASTFSTPSIDRRDVGEADGRAVAVGDDELPVFVGREELVVGADRRRPAAVPSKLPLAWSTLREPRSAVRRSSRLRPWDESAVGFAWTRTAGLWPPLMLTSPTPGSWEIFWARRVSARSSTFESGSAVAT